MLLTKRLFCFFITIIIISTYTGFANNREQQGVENYENLHHLRNSSAPKALSIINARHLGTGSSMAHSGLLFTYSDRSAKDVKIAGNFSNWRPISMKRSKHGVWYFFKKADSDIDTYSYKYIVDGIWTVDPQNHSKSYDNVISYISTVPAARERHSIQITYRIINRNTVEFRIYKPNARLVSLVGDFNNWNPEHDLMTKGNDGIWRLTKRLLNGRTYRYKFLVDGEWVIDLYNTNSGSNQLGELCSLLVLP